MGSYGEDNSSGKEEIRMLLKREKKSHSLKFAHSKLRRMGEGGDLREEMG